MITILFIIALIKNKGDFTKTIIQMSKQIKLFIFTSLFFISSKTKDVGYPDKEYEVLNNYSISYKIILPDQTNLQNLVEEVRLYPNEDCTVDSNRVKTLIGYAIIESNWGKSKLATKYNNYFGIKGNDVDFWTTEIIDGKPKRLKLGFKAFYEPIDSWDFAYKRFDKGLGSTGASKSKYEKLIEEKVLPNVEIKFVETFEELPCLKIKPTKI